MEAPLASIRLRLPIPVAITLAVGLGIMFLYLLTVVLAFVFQNSIELAIGINPARVSIIVLMVVLFIPWGILGWVILKKYAKIGVLHLYANYLTISDANNRVIKTYPANSITMIKQQGNAAHFEFKDNYRFNLINLGMDSNYTDELIRFNTALLAFLNQNNIKAIKGNIL